MEYYHNSKFNLYLDTSQIENAGLGVWTREFINANTYIDDYCGLITSFNSGGSYVLEITKHYYINGDVNPRHYMAMINDCSYVSPKIVRRKKKIIDMTPPCNYGKDGRALENNCIFIIDEKNKRGMVYTTRDIEPNTELFVSYGKNYWN